MLIPSYLLLVNYTTVYEQTWTDSAIFFSNITLMTFKPSVRAAWNI